MSRVRLEITVPDADAHDLAGVLAARYSAGIEDYPCAHVTVETLTDAEAERERVILQAAAYLMRPVREC